LKSPWFSCHSAGYFEREIKKKSEIKNQKSKKQKEGEIVATNATILPVMDM
jgi:hypothetical protein